MQTGKIQATNVFARTQRAGTRIIVHQGGARSSKTFSIIQYLVIKAIEEEGTRITIARSALTNLRDTAYKDFLEVLSISGLATEFKPHLSTLSYKLANGSEIQFIGLEDPLKLHGRKQDYFWFNEANYCSYEDFRQVNGRTTKQIILDFNPSDLYHWIYDKVLPREDCTLIKSTYLDNPFLPDEIKREIEAARLSDPEWFQVYGLGERASSKTLVYPRYDVFNDEPVGRVEYGLDFGYNDPCALVKCTYRDGELYWEEKIYQSYLTTPDLIKLLKELGLTKTDIIKADGSRPEIIADLQRAGFNVRPATKYIEDGINKVKSCRLFVKGENLIKEVQTYKWKTLAKTDEVLDEPVDKNNHAMDAGRYGTYDLVKGKPRGPKAYTPPNRWNN